MIVIQLITRNLLAQDLLFRGTHILRLNSGSIKSFKPSVWIALCTGCGEIELSEFTEANYIYKGFFLHNLVQEFRKFLKEKIRDTSDGILLAWGNTIYSDELTEYLRDVLAEESISTLVLDSSVIIGNHYNVEVTGKLVTGVFRGTPSNNLSAFAGIIRLTPKDFLRLVEHLSRSGYTTVNSILEALNDIIRNRVVEVTYEDVSGFAWWVVNNRSDLTIAEHRFRISENSERFKEKELFVFDLDGTLLVGSERVNGAPQLLEVIKEKGLSFKIISNNSSVTPPEVASRVNQALFSGREIVKKDEVYTSVDYFTEVLWRRLKCPYILLPSKVKEYYGLVECTAKRLEDFDSVVVGFDIEVTYDRLAKASLILQKNPRALFVVVNPDVRCPTEEGFVPDAGSIAKMLELTSGRKPNWIGGKPNEEMLTKVLGGARKDKSVFFGDRIYTDLKMALKAGIDFVLVLSGEAGIEDVVKQGLNELEGVYVVKDLNEFLVLALKKAIGKTTY